MDPEALKNTPAYLVLAYAITWDTELDGSEDAAAGVNLPEYVLLDLRSYQRPEELGEDGLNELVSDQLSDRYDFCVTGFKIKVVEA